jgi:fatty acid desaturase
VAAAITVTVVAQTTILFNLWIVPVVIGYGPAHALIELPEHFLCDRPSKNVFENTRSITGSWFSRWLTNANNHHVAHHYDSTVPIGNLAKYETLMLSKYEFRHKEQSYPRFYARVLKYLWTGQNV